MTENEKLSTNVHLPDDSKEDEIEYPAFDEDDDDSDPGEDDDSEEVYWEQSPPNEAFRRWMDRDDGWRVQYEQAALARREAQRACEQAWLDEVAQHVKRCAMLTAAVRLLDPTNYSGARTLWVEHKALCMGSDRINRGDFGSCSETVYALRAFEHSPEMTKLKSIYYERCKAVAQSPAGKAYRQRLNDKREFTAEQKKDLAARKREQRAARKAKLIGG